MARRRSRIAPKSTAVSVVTLFFPSSLVLPPAVLLFLLLLGTILPVSHSWMFSRISSIHSSSRRTTTTAFTHRFLMSRSSSSISSSSAAVESSSMDSSLPPSQKDEEEEHRSSDVVSSSSSSFSTSTLLEDLAQRVVTANTQQTLPLKATFCIAGGGGQAISTLAATEGASSILLEGTIAYDRHSFHQYVGHNDDAKEQNQNAPIPYVSRQAAAQLSKAALRRGMGLVTNLQSYHGVVGVSCTSSLVSSTSTRANRVSRGHVMATMANGYQWGYDVTLSLPPPPKPKELLRRQRSRLQEDALLSQLVLQTLLDHYKEAEEEDVVEPKEDSDDWVQECRTIHGDDIRKFSSKKEKKDNAVVEGSRRILTQEASVALLVPHYHPKVKEENNAASSTFSLMSRPLLPRQPQTQTLVFPGSFNPPHPGHLALAQAAVQAMKMKQSQEDSSSCSIDDNNNNKNDFSVLFELSLTNADKPSMDPQVASERLQTFLELEKECRRRDDEKNPSSTPNNNIQMPTDWGVLLTSAPLFSDKVDAIQREQPPPPHHTNNNKASRSSDSDDNSAHNYHQSSPLVFIIGTDTLVRILNPKYYGNKEEHMIQAVRDMGNKGVRFVAGGRVEQQQQSSNNSNGDGVFVTGEEELRKLPPDIQDMFVLIREEDFRVDISSTELRQQQQQQQEEEELPN